MVFGYLIGLLSMFYVCTVSTANDETAVNFDVKCSTCDAVARCLDAFLIIIIVRSLEMKPYSATFPCFCPKKDQPKLSWSRFSQGWYHDPVLTSDIVVSSEIDAVGKNKIENGKLSSGRTTLNALNSWAENPSRKSISE